MASRPNRAPGSSVQARLDQRAASDKKRQELLAAMAARAAARVEKLPPEPPPRLQRNAAEIIKSASDLKLYPLGDSTSQALSTLYVSLIESAVGVMNTGQPLVFLAWPPHPVSLAAVVDLIVLGDMASAPQTEVFPAPDRKDVIAAAPFGVRTVVFPYARTTHTAAKQIQVDRKNLATLQTRHFLRGVRDHDDPAFKDYHLVVSRVKAMTGVARDGNRYAEFEHPILDELVPHALPTAGCSEKGTLLWRTKSKTDLGELTRTGAADRPETARFFLYTIHASDSIEREVKAIKRAPDLVILDLTSAGRARLGRDWIAGARRFADAVQSTFPSTGILCVTDDPWTLDTSRFDLFGVLCAPKKQPMPSASRTIYAPSASILEDAAQIVEPWAGANSVGVDGFAGHGKVAIDQARAVATKLRDAGNTASADHARNIIAKLRRSVSLPGSLSELSAFLEHTAGDSVAADNMAAFRIDQEINALSDFRLGASSISSDDLNALKATANPVVAEATEATPMASLLEAYVAPALRSSSRTIFVFRSEMISDFALDRFSHGQPKLPEKLQKGIIRFTSSHGILDLAADPAPVRNQFKTLVVISPTRAMILEMLSNRWLPERVVFLADSDTLRFAARDAVRLSTQIGVPVLAARLKKFADASDQRLRELGCHTITMDAQIPPAEDIDFPFGSLIDLSGSHRGNGKLLELKVASGQRILARPGTGLVQQDKSKAVSRFIEIPAKELSVGDEICVISPSFVERARTVLNITAAAAAEIRDYHEMVLKRFAALPGLTEGDRLRSLCSAMGQPTIEMGRAHYWIELEEELEKPLHEVVPHAPQDKDTFLRFTSALGISATLATHFWAWAVIAQRSSRMRAGAAFHDAYKGILTDEHAAMAQNKDRGAEIRALRLAAVDHVSQVVSIKDAVQP